MTHPMRKGKIQWEGEGRCIGGVRFELMMLFLFTMPVIAEDSDCSNLVMMPSRMVSRSSRSARSFLRLWMGSSLSVVRASGMRASGPEIR